MLKFLFVDTERVWRGGQGQLLSLLIGLHNRGHKIHLICQPKTLLENRARENGITIHPLSVRSEIGLIAFFRLLAVLRQVRPEVLAFNTPKAILPGVLASRFVPRCVRLVFRRVNFPLHRNIVTLLKYTWGIDCVVAISESIRLQLRNCGVPTDKIKKIYEGMDLAFYPRRDISSRRGLDKPVVIGTVAHLSHEKGLDSLIRAAALIPDVHKKLRFVIVGDGACRPKLEELVREKGLQDCFHFWGFQSNASDHLKSFDIFALPSLSEGLSSAILEAMASSLPIVATDVGGIPELVTNGYNGLLVPPANPEALAEAIRKLAEHPEESLQMGRRGRERMEEHFTLDRKISETEQLCRLFYEKVKRPKPSVYV
jgi:glycosyltransferase involved in cell wall biosynthesis